jgi:Zn-dependent protease
MIWFEARRGGVPFGVGFVLLILVHELGHGFAMRRAGVEASWPVFIPFFGAMIAMKGRPASSAVEAEIAYGGPLAGTAASLLCAAGYLLFDSRLLLALAYTGFFLNLFNLVPVSPLDGGRVAQAFSRRAWIVGGLLLGGMFLATHTPQLLFIGVLAAMHAIRGGGTPHEVPATPEEQRAWTTRYFGLCFFLGAAMWFARQLLIPGAT